MTYKEIISRFITASIIIYVVRVIYYFGIPWITSNYSQYAAQNAALCGVIFLMSMYGFEDTYKKTRNIKQALSCFVFVTVLCFSLWALHRLLTYLFA